MSRHIAMSYPHPRWRIRGAENFRSRSKQATNPRRAAEEWLGVADAIEAAGGQVLVLPPADTDPPLTGMMYTANAGALFPSGFLVSRMGVAHREAEAPYVEAWAKELGVPVARAAHRWEGQAEIATLPGERYILTWGVRSDRESVDEVKTRLPEGARTLVIQLRAPYFHGDTCLSSFATPRGHVLLACAEALVDATLDDLRRFAGDDVEVIRISEEDTLNYAANALAIGDRWLAPKGLSAELEAAVSRRGLTVTELELSELFGKGGGGPRCLVNELRGLASAPDSLRYSRQRAALARTIAAYPTSA